MSFQTSTAPNDYDPTLQQFGPAPIAQATSRGGNVGFRPAAKNVLNGPKIDPKSPESWPGPDPDNRTQSTASQGDECKHDDDDEAWRLAAEHRFLELRALRLAREAAQQVSTEPEHQEVPRIVIPSSTQIEARRRRGRPKVIDQDMRQTIVELLGAGASLTQTAAYVGVGRNTIVRAQESDEEFAQEIHEARQRASLLPLNCLLREAAKSWRAAAWLLTYLERKDQQEQTRRERVYQAADEKIERDLVEELREQARQQRQAQRAGGDDQPPATCRAPRPKQPRRSRLKTDSSRAVSRGDSDV